jgi:hypothetical protein
MLNLKKIFQEKRQKLRPIRDLGLSVNGSELNDLMKFYAAFISDFTDNFLVCITGKFCEMVGHVAISDLKSILVILDSYNFLK